MRSAVKDRRREWPAAMTMYRNLTARANCWRKLGSTCPNRLRSIPALHMSPRPELTFGHGCKEAKCSASKYPTTFIKLVVRVRAARAQCDIRHRPQFRDALI